MNIYADSSFLTSIYLLDVHSAEALRRMALKPDIWLTPFHETEVAHAISQGVFRGRISAKEADLVGQNFARDRDGGLWRQADFPAAAFPTSIALARRYGGRIGSRSLDSIHVACALELKATRFWTFDDRQAKLARAAGLKAS